MYTSTYIKNELHQKHFTPDTTTSGTSFLEPIKKVFFRAIAHVLEIFGLYDMPVFSPCVPSAFRSTGRHSAHKCFKQKIHMAHQWIFEIKKNRRTCNI